MLVDISDVALSFEGKVCFEGFSAKIYNGDRIALIGDNGSGKTQLLKLLAGITELQAGRITRNDGLCIGYVPQTVEEFTEASGGERFNRALSGAVEGSNLLILDEPTNHLDTHNRASLLRMLKKYDGALIFASHDEDFLAELPDKLWHINNSQISVFSGSYSDYTVLLQKEREILQTELAQLKTEKKRAHSSLMKEQKRAKKSRATGEKGIKNHKRPPIMAGMMKAAAENTAGQKATELKEKREYIRERLDELSPMHERSPRFIIPSNFNKTDTAVHIIGGSAGYNGKTIVSGVNIVLSATGRLVLSGANGSGKSTLAKAILDSEKLRLSGEWYTPNQIGYLDQHYINLKPEKTVFESVRDVSDLPVSLLRSHLGDFLFYTNSEVNCKVCELSGGEKARLSLAVMALSPKALLILDEITNNIDLKTKKYIAALLKEFPAALILISHELSFIRDVCGETPLIFDM
ncbi:MAG: ATP-binding cassette domain-containing protein [Deferribacteraceae bacterium]|jgi:ATPase subunit of ABC transporter with duplicated ATPase domains|nr:ATP-binding cassette domain-containing protein [Deferribacteraceae bacterium]